MFDVNKIQRKPNTPSASGAAGTGASRDLEATTPARSEQPNPNLKVAAAVAPPTLSAPEPKLLQAKLPVITGEAQYKGMLNLDGMVTGQLSANGGSLTIRQRSRSFMGEPEFSGEIVFRDMIRVNGHIAGDVCSQKGTMIVDISACVDGNISVGVAVISGIVNGDIVAHERVEIGPNAKIYGNIWTRSIEIKHGAIFEGVCTMLADENLGTVESAAG
jgi:cytoskeletal protein CcmA (bactofilin family)